MINNTDEIIKQGLQEIDNELKVNQEIKEQAADIAKVLVKNQKDKIHFNNKTFTLSLTYKANKIVLLFMSDSLMRKSMIANKPPIPGQIVGDYNDEFSEFENLVAVVEAFLLNEIGELKISSEDDN